jgi:hypothetical protein
MALEIFATHRSKIGGEISTQDIAASPISSTSHLIGAIFPRTAVLDSPFAMHAIAYERAISLAAPAKGTFASQLERFRQKFRVSPLYSHDPASKSP